MKKSLLPYILVAAIGVTAGVGITAVLEDVAGMPYEKVDFNLFDPENVDIDALIDMIADHPEWSDAIFDWIKEHPDMLDDLTPEQLADLIGEHPEMAEDILNNLADKLSPEELADLLNDPALADLIAENPELAALAAGYIISQMGDLDFSEEGVEPSVNNGDSINAAMGGSGGSIDDGSLNPDDFKAMIFSFDSNYSGPIYLRSSSKGDYSSEKRAFMDAPEFDNSTYYLSPVLFPGMALAQSYSRPLSIRLNMHMGSFRDEGMIVGDYCGASYTVNGESGKFSRLYENKIGNVDISDYTVTAYPTADIGSGSFVVPNALSEPEQRYRKWVKQNYLNVPDSIRNQLRGFLDAHGLYTPSDVENYLKKNYSYEVGTFSCPAGQDIVLTFLNESSGGTCTNFASAMTLLCRTLGKPARFVTGYYVNAQEGSNEVLGNMGHAWTEVYCDGVGWQRFDATASINDTPDPDDETPATEKNHKEYDMHERGLYSNEDPQSLFFVEGNSISPLYLRSRAYDKYDESTSQFLPVEIAEDDKDWAKSMFFENDLAGDLDGSYGSSVTIHYSGDFVPDGMLTPANGIVSKTYTVDGIQRAFAQMDDSRFYRDGSSKVTMVFAKDGSYSLNNSVSSAQIDYYNNLRMSDYYSEYPASWGSMLDGWSGSLNWGEDKPTAEEVHNFFKNYYYDNLPSPSVSDPIVRLLMDSDVKHMSRHNVLVGLETLVLRRLGYRARFVDGFRVVGSETYVTYQDNFSWVEVFNEKQLYWETLVFESNSRPVETLINYSVNKSSVVYNGERQEPQQPTINGQALGTGDTIEWAYKGSLTDVGNYRIRVDDDNTKVRNIFGDDVSEYYRFEATGDSGIFSITACPLTVTTPNMSVDIGYNPSMSYDKPQAYFSGLVPGDEAEIIYPDRTYDAFGEYENAVSIRIINSNTGKDVTKNYQITYEFGILKVGEIS